MLYRNISAGSRGKDLEALLNIVPIEGRLGCRAGEQGCLGRQQGTEVVADGYSRDVAFGGGWELSARFEVYRAASADKLGQLEQVFRNASEEFVLTPEILLLRVSGTEAKLLLIVSFILLFFQFFLLFFLIAFLGPAYAFHQLFQEVIDVIGYLFLFAGIRILTLCLLILFLFFIIIFFLLLFFLRLLIFLRFRFNISAKTAV